MSEEPIWLPEFGPDDIVDWLEGNGLMTITDGFYIRAHAHEDIGKELHRVLLLAVRCHGAWRVYVHDPSRDTTNFHGPSAPAEALAAFHVARREFGMKEKGDGNPPYQS